MYKLFFLGWFVGILLTTITGPLGSFIVWKKMSSFGDSLSHSSLLGIACAIILNIHPFYVVIVILLLFSILVAWLENCTTFSLDTILGIISYSSLSLGMIIMKLVSNSKKIRFTNYLFGDLLQVTYYDVFVVLIVCIFVLLILLFFWNPMLLVTIDPDLAKIDGINPYKINILLILLIASTIGISIKFIGSLIIIALLVIPSATAQRFSTSPEKMAIFSTLIGMLSITGGIFISILLDIPTSPSIVLVSAMIFLFSTIKCN